MRSHATPSSSPGTDALFFREWEARRPDARRSLERARSLLDLLGLPGLLGSGSPEPPEPHGVPVLTVVGSKGKGTAATYASARLSAAGLLVLTVTSPGLRSNRERIRVGGRALTDAELAALAATLGDAIDASAALDRGAPTGTAAGAGYLSPAGLFLLAGILHARRIGADAMVLEAGMGGAHDEVSLVPASAVAITPVFGEHLGVLGDSPAEIAEEKAAVAAETTRAVLSVPQDPAVMAALTRTVARCTGGRTEVEVVGMEPPAVLAGDGAGAAAPPAGLNRGAALLGVAAADRLLELHGLPRAPAERSAAVLSTVSLPGRLSWHQVPGTPAEVLADCAIDRTGVAVALDAASRRWGRIDRVLLCLPDHKDLDGAVDVLGNLPVTFVRLRHAHLRFDRRLPPGWRVVDVADLTATALAAQGDHLVALGTVYFIGRVLDLVDADTERLYAV